MSCPQCNGPLARLADPPPAGGFEFTLYRCPACGSHHMHCYCVSTSRSATEPVSAEDAAALGAASGPERKAFIKAWQEKVIGD